MQKLVLATNNAGKVTEFQQLLSVFNFEIIPQSLLNIPAVEETGQTFVENALLKARYAALHSGLPAIADDSGLIVDALHGAPGVYSARYAGENVSAEKHIAKLLTAMDDLSNKQRTAHYYCVLVYLAYADDPVPLIAEGRLDGEILTSPQGKGGFGYDPVFFVPSHGCSAAELSAVEKNKISHRGQAMQGLLKKLQCCGFLGKN